MLIIFFKKIDTNICVCVREAVIIGRRMTNPLSKLGAGYAALSNLFTCLSPLENRSKQHSRHAIPGSVRSQRQSRFNKKCPQRPPALQISFQSSTEHRKKYSKGIGSLKMQYKQLSCTSICKLFVILIFFFCISEGRL